MIKKSPDMLLLEESFRDIKMKENTAEALHRIQRILKRNFDLDFKISIVDNKTNKFFGMSIYPDMGQLQKIISSIINNQPTSDAVNAMWQETKVWNLEIDSILLHDSTMNANPTEITAVLLHEIGHIVYSNSIPQRVNKILRYRLASSSLSVKKLIKWDKAQKIIQLVFIEACSSKNFNSSPLKSEKVADKFAVKAGYGEPLEQFINKLLLSQGNKQIDRPTNQVDNDVTAAVNWVLGNISELEFRKTAIRQTLQSELLKNPSQYVRSVVNDIKLSFFGLDDSDVYKNVVREQYLMDEYKGIVKEGFLTTLFDKNGKFKKISQVDLDIIAVQANKIKSDDDKIYVLDLIYDKINIIDAGLDMIKDGKKDKVPHSKDTLNSFRSQLNKIRLTVLDAPIMPPYRISVDYPAGYRE